MTSTKVILICLAITFSITVICCVNVHQQNQINTWASEHGYTVIEISRVFNPFEGPFWRHKNDTLFRAKLQKDGAERLSYFHFNFWGMRQAWKGD